MNYAVVSTKRSSLKVYTTSNSAEKNKIGVIPKGTTVEVLDSRTVNNVEWVKVKTDRISGWVILQHPSLSYSYLEPAVNTFALSNSHNTLYNTAVVRQNSTSKISEIINTENKGSTTLTKGEVPDIENNRNYYSKVVNNQNLQSVTDFSFTGQKHYVNSDESKNLPQNVQNSKGFPVEVYDSGAERYKYNYEMDYADNGFITALNDIKKSINFHEDSSIQLFERYAKYYNRFKVATPDDTLTRTFAHVFFTRPDCNICYTSGSDHLTLSDEVKNDPDYLREFKNNPGLLMQLSQAVGLNHEFMMLPSNRVNSFECKDRTIKSDTYGKTYRGNSISYGKSIDESTAASEVSISFTDDRDLHLFRMHQLWVEYISDVNKGRLRPMQNHLTNRCLDYACSAYYIVCAENGEDIIYWSKLYGVFPTNIPDSVMTWNKSQYITNPEISITYQYSFKKDWHAETIAEFNLNSSGDRIYLPSYNPYTMSTGNTWVGAPFIEMVKDNLGRTVYKLRFRQY